MIIRAKIRIKTNKKIKNIKNNDSYEIQNLYNYKYQFDPKENEI